MRLDSQILTRFFTGTSKIISSTSSWRGLFRRVVFVLLAFAWSAGAWAYSGTGTEGDPYVISGANANTNWTDLKTVMALGGYIRLDANCTDGTKNSTSYLEVPSGKTVTLNLNGKTINRNLGSAIEKGYVIKNEGTLTINGNGTITGGKNTSEGGGIYTSSGTLTINGGSITGNSSTEGGGIYYANGYLNINGGSITANSATSNGGGIYNNAYNMSVSGNCTIKDNLKGTNQNNVYLKSLSNYIIVYGNLDSETRIGVTTGGDIPIKIVDNHSTNNSHKYVISASNFTPDNTSQVVALTDNGYVFLSKKNIDDSPNDRTIVLEIPLHSGSEWTNVELMGKGTFTNPYQIGSVKEWEAFATIVNADGGKLDACAILTADITFTGNHQQVGEDGNFSFVNNGYQRYYRGTFDGRGHTITLKFGATGGKNNQPTWGGLFWHIRSATIQNLKVAGEIRTAKPECGTIVQHAGNVQIINCESTVKIICEASSEENRKYVGGLLGTHYTVNGSPNSLFKNCYFHGEFSASDSYSCYNSGGFVGGRNNSHDKITIQNSYSYPALILSLYRDMYSFGINIPTPTNSFYNFSKRTAALHTSGGQGTNASTLTATNIVSGLNNLESGTQDSWVAHNDTVYLKTFAKYVDIAGWTYGSPNTPTIVGNNGNGAVTYQYKVQGAADNTYATYTPGETVLGAGNYTLKASVAAVTDGNGEKWNAWESTMNFTVSKAEGTFTAAPTAASPTYSGIAQGLLATNGTATGTFYYREGTSGDWSTTPPTETAVGTYSVYYYVTPDGNHNTIDAFGNAESPLGPIEVTIGKAALTVTAKNHSITYGDAPENIGVNYSGFVNSETSAVLGGTLAYAYSYAQYDNAGSYTITPSGLTSSNYAITYTPGTLTVGQKEVGLTWSTDSPFTYDGQSHCLTATATGMVNSDEIGVTVTGAQTSAGDSYTATASELTGTKSGNYKLPDANTQTFTINRRAVTVTPSDDQSKTYGDSDPTITYNVDGLLGLVPGESLSGTLERAAGKDVNTYAITQGTVTNENNGNYDITFTTGKTFAITPKTIGISWGPTILTYNSSAQAPTATATGLVGSDVCNLSVTGQQTAVGVYTITDAPATVTALDNTNYQLPTTGLTTGFEIVNPLSISFAANQLWATWYGGYNFEVPTGMTAYKVSSVSGSTVTVDAITYVPANTGVLIKRTATDAAVVNSNVYNGETSAITSLLRNGSPTPYTDYILYNDGFVLSSVSTIGEHRCYLPGTGTASTRGLTIDFGNGTTDISTKTAEVFDSGEWFDLQGRRIEKPQKKGLYIHDGKKVVVK